VAQVSREVLSTETTHRILLVLYCLVLGMAIWGLVSQSQDIARLPIATWAATGAVSAVGAILAVLLQLRTRRALKVVKEQIRRMSDEAQVGLVMIEDDQGLTGLGNILNHYLTTLRNEFNELSRQRRELGLLVAAVDAEKQNVEAVIKSISDAVIILNAFGEVILANRSAERIFGFDLHCAEGQPFDQVVNDQRIGALIDQARDDCDRPTSTELWATDATGATRCFDLNVCPVYIKDDTLWAIVVTLHDVTEERELAELKTEFVNHVSHELRTPLTNIKAHIELLLDNDVADADREREFYRVILAETERLERFIANILDLSKIDSGLMPFSPDRVQLTSEAERLMSLIRPSAAEKQITLALDVPANLHVWADRELLGQTILNLLSNAVKYTPVGGKVTLRAESTARSDACLIEVIDTGAGLSPQDQTRIFEKFYRAKSTSGLAEGTGLGLALSKKIVEELHGGKLSVQSTPGEGSKFTIELPLPETRDASDREQDLLNVERC